MRPRLTRSGEETRALGATLGKAAKTGDLVVLCGPLGSGKTTFAQGFAEGAGFRGSAVSPSFALTRRYRARGKTIHHLDLYRLAGSDLANLGLEEYLDDPAACCLVEWPEVALSELRGDRLVVTFEHVGEGERRLAFEALGPRSRELLRALGAARAGRRR